MPRPASRTNTTKRTNYSANNANYSAKTQRRVLRIKQVCERTGLARSTLYKAIAEGKFPAPIALLAGGKAVGWDEAAVDQHLEDRFADPTPRLPINTERAKAKAMAG
jgi:prophage regulatory protein